MKALLIIVLVAALALAIVGFLIEALLWLAALGLVLFLVTGAYWWWKFRSDRDREVDTTR